MSKHDRHARQDLNAHLGVRQALETAGVTGPLLGIETLKLTKKAEVHRLQFPSGTKIMKRARKNLISLDVDTYAILAEERFLVPQVFGIYDAHNQSDSWILMEDMGSVHPDEKDPNHQQLVGTWAATLHTTGCAHADRIQSKDIEYYQTVATETNAGLSDLRRAAGWSPSQADTLSRLEELTSTSRELMDRIAPVLRELPRTVTHGDLVTKNLLLVDVNARPTVVCIDWETVGWGTPAPDLSRINTAAYFAYAHVRWPNLRLDTLARQATIGVFLRLIQAVAWDLESARWPSGRERAFARLDLYAPRLGGVLPIIEGSL